MKHDAEKELLGQYLNGITDDRLSAVIQGWLFGALRDPDMDAEMERRFDGMVVSEEPTEETRERLRKLEDLLTPARPKAISLKRKRMLLRVAAVLIPAFIAAGAFVFLSKPKPQPLAENPIIEGTHVVTEPGHQKKVELADNSQVTVNENSRIVYADDFQVRREVYVDGEAHFVVEKDPGRPFFVRTKYVTIEVTGTEFNVRALEDEERMTVALASGSVRIVADERETSLKPGQEFGFDYATRQSTVAQNSGDGWWAQPIVFRDMTLHEIFERIEGYYGVVLEGKEQFSDPTRYNIGFDRGESVESVLGTISRFSQGFTFSVSGQTIALTKSGGR